MKKFLPLTSSLMAILLMTAPAYAETSADDIAALKAQIDALTKKVDKLQAEEKKTEAAQAAAPASAAVASDDVVTKGSFPGSFHVPGTSTSVKIGGYLKADVNVDVGEGYGSPFARYANIPLSTSVQKQQGEQTTFGAQQSRLNFETRTDTSVGLVRTYIETDFYNGTAATNGNLNGYGIQLRHAYGSLGTSASDFGQILAGQTWTNFQDTDAVSESLDYLGASGRVFVRQPQVRYSKDIGQVTASASAEAALGNDSLYNTANGVTNIGTATGTSAARGSLPDMTLRGDWKYASDGYVSLRGLLSEINMDHAPTTTVNETATKLGYAFGVSGKQSVFGKDNIHYDIDYGRGTGRYVYDIGAGSNYYNTGTGSLETQEWMAGNAGYQHLWNDHFRSNVFFGFARNENNLDVMKANAATANKWVASGSLNLLWQPAPAYMMGVEYMHGYRKVEAGTEGNLNRIETSFQYNF